MTPGTQSRNSNQASVHTFGCRRLCHNFVSWRRQACDMVRQVGADDSIPCTGCRHHVRRVVHFPRIRPAATAMVTLVIILNVRVTQSTLIDDASEKVCQKDIATFFISALASPLANLGIARNLKEGHLQRYAGPNRMVSCPGCDHDFVLVMTSSTSSEECLNKHTHKRPNRQVLVTQIDGYSHMKCLHCGKCFRWSCMHMSLYHFCSE
jgi:hypothetical protein